MPSMRSTSSTCETPSRSWYSGRRNVRSGVTMSLKRIVLVLLILIVIALVAMILILRRGLSAREAPTRTEAVIARAMRHFAVPARLRAARNPIPFTPEVLAEAREHFADHCAQCHGN